MADSIDESTFEQILEMDDDDDRDFSKGIVFGFFEQADSTFEKMEKALYVPLQPQHHEKFALMSAARRRNFPNCRPWVTSLKDRRQRWA